jgi:hypothetical protein
MLILSPPSSHSGAPGGALEFFLSDEDGDGGFGVTKSVARFRRRISQLVLPSAASAVLLAGVIALIRLAEYPSRW